MARRNTAKPKCVSDESGRSPALLHTRRLTPDDGPIVAQLFGANGACGGCWCMHWRMERGADWDSLKGARNRRSLLKLIAADSVTAVLAFSGELPVGWCQLGPRDDFPRLLRSRVMNPGAPAGTWAVTCFFIPEQWRQRGVASALLAEAVTVARSAGARRLEGHPVRDRNPALGKYPATFAFTGVSALFAAAGFRDCTPKGASRPLYRRSFHRAASTSGSKR